MAEVFILLSFPWRPFSRLDCNVATDLGLAGQDVIPRLVFFGEGILHGHPHIARHKLDAARSARSRATGVVDSKTTASVPVAATILDAADEAGVFGADPQNEGTTPAGS
jgi:hypothetical protein